MQYRFERVVEESLQRLREHNQVSLAYYMSARKVFIVTKNDLTICGYLVKGTKRKMLDMEHDQAHLLHSQFHKAISAVMESLASEEGIVDREGSDDLVDQAEY